MSINLKLPHVSDLKPRITVFGVGGAGGNAVNNMIESNLEGVEFVVANTDAQALAQSAADRRVQMGTALTEGLGAGSQPQIGAAAAEEALPEIIDHLAGAHMVFITAGMGGGTGTGAAPVIARASKEQGILTVGVVTKPFHFEGQRRMATADRGIDQLAQHVDTLIVIPNQNLFRVANEKTTFADAFAMADQVLYSGVGGITDLMIKEGLINLDFADVRSVMSEMGKAMMGTGEAGGEKRAVEAAEAAISNPLLDDVSMRGARGLLISISGGSDLTLYEVDEAATRIREEVDPDANIILGATFDDKLEGVMRVSVVATGITNEIVGERPVYDSEPVDAFYQAPAEYSIPQTQQSDFEAPYVSAEREMEEAVEEQSAAEMVAADEPEVEMPQMSAEEQFQHEYEAEISIERVAEPEVQMDAPQMEAPQPEPVIRESTPAPAPAEDTGYAPRMPQVEDFPPIAQRQIAAKTGQVVEDLASHSQKRRRGFLERLANVGIGGRKEPVAIPVEPNEPALSSQFGAEAPAPQQSAVEERPVRVHPMDNRIDPDIDDEQLEIPAFLRRQAN